MSYDIEQETMASRKMLEARLSARLNDIYRLLVENRQGLEPRRLALTIDLVQSVERNCGELVETIGKDKFPAAAWIARNLLELLVWVKYCGVSRENPWRFHEDALRDVKGLTELHKKSCEAMGIENETSAITAQRKGRGLRKAWIGGYRLQVPHRGRCFESGAAGSPLLTDFYRSSLIRRRPLCTASRISRKSAGICKRFAQRKAYISQRRAPFLLKRS